MQNDSRLHHISSLSGHDGNTLHKTPGQPFSGYSIRAIAVLTGRAMKKEAISHTLLAEILGIPASRELDTILEEVRIVLDKLGQTHKEKIPELQLLAINTKTGLPWCSLYHLLHPDCPFDSLRKEHQSALVNALHRHIFGYPHWKNVLFLLGISPASAEKKHISKNKQNR